MAFERGIKSSETPIGKYFTSVKKIQERKEQDAANLNESKGLPNKTNDKKKNKKNKKVKEEEEEEENEVSEDEVDNEVNDSDFDEMDEDNDMDIVEDFVLSDDE